MEVRAYVYIDRMQPSFAALIGCTVAGDPPVAGMSELYIEVAPGNEVFRVVDLAVKSADVRPGWQIVEREFGMLEIHSASPDSVRHAGEIILSSLGMSKDQANKPEVGSTQIITNVDAYQAQLINKMKRGSLVIPGETLYIMEVTPAAYIVAAANEAEKAANINIVEITPVGRFGRLYLAGPQSEVKAAQEASVAAIRALAGN
ncbi:MAG: BMC domain-containing protein [Dehalococcoidales bacterium]|nr:BMC domain-containing protein [Dehalococcoidales bacterium]